MRSVVPTIPTVKWHDLRNGVWWREDSKDGRLSEYLYQDRMAPAAKAEWPDSLSSRLGGISEFVVVDDNYPTRMSSAILTLQVLIARYLHGFAPTTGPRSAQHRQAQG